MVVTFMQPSRHIQVFRLCNFGYNIMRVNVDAIKLTTYTYIRYTYIIQHLLYSIQLKWFPSSTNWHFLVGIFFQHFSANTVAVGGTFTFRKLYQMDGRRGAFISGLKMWENIDPISTNQYYLCEIVTRHVECPILK